MVRRTISMTEDLDRRIRRVADERRISYSAAVAELIQDRLDEPLPYEGGDWSGPGDLAENVDKYLDRLVAERMEGRR